MKKAIKSAARAIVDATLVPIARHTLSRLDRSTVLTELERRTSAECAEYALARMQRALQFEKRRDLWDHALSQVGTAGLIAEFGVWKGDSINHIAARSRPATVYGFDSFEGLGEDWAGWELTKGKFSLGGRLPRVRPNVRLVKGWFDKTIPEFLAGTPDPFAFVHVDSDTYEAASTVLRLIGGRLRAGTVLVFDEYFGYRGWRIGEYKAWQEFVAERSVEYRYVAFSDKSVSVAILAMR